MPFHASLSLLIRGVHVLSMAVLTGGAVTMWALCSRAASQKDGSSDRVLLQAATSYERLFWVCAGLLVLTGVGNLAISTAGRRLLRRGYAGTSVLAASETLMGNRLVEWSLAGFHTTVFSLVVVLALYRSGSLGGILGGLSTGAGVGAFAWLWLITWWSTRRALRDIPSFASLQQPLVASQVRLRGLYWGAVNGAVLVYVLGAASIVVTLAETDPDQ